MSIKSFEVEGYTVVERSGGQTIKHSFRNPTEAMAMAVEMQEDHNQFLTAQAAKAKERREGAAPGSSIIDLIDTEIEFDPETSKAKVVVTSNLADEPVSVCRVTRDPDGTVARSSTIDLDPGQRVSREFKLGDDQVLELRLGTETGALLQSVAQEKFDDQTQP